MSDHVKFKDSVKFIDVEAVQEGTRVREDFGNMQWLIDSVREKGVFQPITVTTDMMLIAGHRRLKAAREVGLKKIPALVRELNDGEIDLREVELLENIARKAFTWQEEANGVRQLHELYKTKGMDWSQRKTAQLLNIGVAGVNRALQLSKAAEQIPEVAEAKTADDALKILKKLEEDVIIGELRARQQAQLQTTETSNGLNRGIKDMLRIADANYRIDNVFDGMADLRDNSPIHIIECDPPYGINLNEQKKGNAEPTSTAQTYEEIPSEEYNDFLVRLTKELYRVAGKDCWLVFWYGPTWHTQVYQALCNAGWQVDDIPAIWNKTTGQTNAPELYFARCYEPFFLCRKGQPVMRKRGRSNVFIFQPVAGQKKYHPTQRPIELIQEILSTLGVDLQTVFVPFLGSGTTLRAAYKCGMSGFGYDLNGEYKDKFMLAVEDDARHLNDEELKEDDVPDLSEDDE